MRGSRPDHEQAEECAGGVRAVVMSAVEPTALLSEQGRIRCHNGAMAALLGADGDSLTGRTLFEFVHARHRAALREDFAAALEQASPSSKRLRLSGVGGGERRVQVHLTNLLREPGVEGVLVAVRDVGRLTEAEERLLHGAVHDPATGLPGRPALLDRFARLAAEGRQASVLVFAVERFAMVREGFGRRMGDEFVVALSDRIGACLEPSDALARLDGDRLGVLQADGDRERALDLAHRVLAALGTPLVVGGRSALCAVRVGISPPDDPTAGAEERVRRASVAAGVQAESDHGVVVLYTPAMGEALADRLRVEAELRDALERDELVAHLQPIVDLSSGGVRAFEALIRWQHPERGLLGAGAFMPVAEESDLVEDVGWWMLDHVCRELGSRVARALPTVPIHVNVAPAQIGSGELVERVARALQAHACPAGLLHLEVTESATMLSPERVAQTLAELRAVGVDVSIDDFGTGHSSLSYLHRFPASVLKIDRSFVSGIRADAKQAPLVRAIVAVAHELGLKVVAEGIETPEEADVLRGMGCELGQGYLFSRPVAMDEALGLLTEGP